MSEELQKALMTRVSGRVRTWGGRDQRLLTPGLYASVTKCLLNPFRVYGEKVGYEFEVFAHFMCVNVCACARMHVCACVCAFVPLWAHVQ